MNPMPMFRSVTPLIPGGSDVAQTIAFYEQELGFGRTWHDGDPIEIAGIRRGAVEILLVRNDDRHWAEQTSLRIEVEHIEGLYEEYQARGGAMIHPNGKLEAKPWGAKEFAVRDPIGVCITFYEYVR